MEIIAILIAVGIGWAVTRGIEGHMAASDATLGNSGGAGTTGGPDCMAVLDTLPTGSSDIDNLRNATKKAFTVASTPTDAAYLRTLADGLSAAGYNDAATCLRTRANAIDAGLVALPSGAGTATGLPGGVITPTLPLGPSFPI